MRGRKGNPVMFLPPENRRPGYPPAPDTGLTRRSEALLLALVVLFLLALMLAPIGGASVIDALVALFRP
jgi:hypothetical protein